MTDFMHDFSINVIFKTMSPMHSKQQKLKFSYYITMAEKGHGCKHSPFFLPLHSSFFSLQNYTRRFFLQNYTRRFFNAIITRDVFSKNYTRRFFNAIITSLGNGRGSRVIRRGSRVIGRGS